MVSTAPDTKVADFVRGLALAWKNLAAYPTGHPALAASLDSVHLRLNELRGPAGDVVLGVAADGLLYGQTKIDSLYAQKLAHALHVRGVALMRFSLETSAGDLETFLRLVSAAHPRPLAEELTAAGIVNIYLQHVDYSAVQMTSDLDAPPPPKPEAATLWEEILRALLAGRELSAEGEALASGMRSVDELAAMIVQSIEAESPHAEFDPNATFGVKFTARVPEPPAAQTAKLAETIALYVAGATGARKRVAMQQVLQLLRSLPQPIREAILRAVTGALAADEDAAPLREFASALPPDEVLDALQYLASTSNLSEHAMLLLRSLINAREQTHAAAATPEVVEDLITLFGDEDIDRFNPPDHRALLEQVSIEIPTVVAGRRSIDELGVRVDSVADDVLNRHFARTLIEMLASRGASGDAEPALARLESLFRAFVAGGAFADALELLDRLSEQRLPLERFADINIIRALVEMHDAPPETAAVIRQLTERLGIVASRGLLMALADEDNLGRRRRLFDFAVSLGPAIVPAATQFLADDRWFVVRNMIILLRTVNDRTSLAEIRGCAHHGDMRVRMEAIKSLLALDSTVPRALLDEAIHARDPKLAEAAITLVGSYGIKEAVDPLLRMIGGNDVFGARRPLRIRAIKALGELAVPGALPPMQRFFRDSWLPWPSKDERRAAYESLASYPAEARAALVEKGLSSRDPAIRAICRRLAGAS
jgi:hypothetical protein